MRVSGDLRRSLRSGATTRIAVAVDEQAALQAADTLFKLLLLIVACCLLWSPTADAEDAVPRNDPVTVFAAASLSDVIAEIGAQWKENGGAGIRLNAASSSTLARQIEDGAPCDVYISANAKWADHLDGKSLLLPGTRVDLLRNRLVLIAPRDSVLTLDLEKDDLPSAFGGRLAVGDPAHVPAGMYAKAALEHHGWYERLKDRLAPAADVRSALLFVEQGETQAGICYATDAARSKAVRVIATFAADSHPPIVCIAAVCSGRAVAGVPFLGYLKSPAAATVFGRHGFEPLHGRP